jgi:uncharacterized protein YdaU (DUF1376 family)
MTDKPDVWIPIYIGDYLADTGRLTTEQHGAYLLLIFDYWRSGPPPDDDAQLAKITGLTLRDWRKNRPVLARFFQIMEGVWRHKRVEAELEGWAKRKRSAVERAEKAAAARWKDAPSNARSNAPSTPQAMLEQCPSSSPLVGEPKEGSPHQRRPSGRAPEKARPPCVWPGPPEIRDAIVAQLGEAWAVSWLDPCTWQEVPHRGLRPATRTAATHLARHAGKILSGFEVVIISEAA